MSELELDNGPTLNYLLALGSSGCEMREMLVHVYGNNAVKEIAVYNWVARFSKGRERVTDKET
jgi:hypothetical protein